MLPRLCESAALDAPPAGLDHFRPFAVQTHRPRQLLSLQANTGINIYSSNSQYRFQFETLEIMEPSSAETVLSPSSRCLRQTHMSQAIGRGRRLQYAAR